MCIQRHHDDDDDDDKDDDKLLIVVGSTSSPSGRLLYVFPITRTQTRARAEVRAVWVQ